jgi:anthranilate synthase component 1
VAAHSFNASIGIIIHDIQVRVDLRKLQRQFPQKYPFLLASSASGSHLSRYDILFALPGEQLVLEKLHELNGPCFGKNNGFLDSLDSWWESERTMETDLELPFIGGWFLFLGYELAAEIEPTLHITPDSILPTAFAVRCKAAIIHDHKHDRFYAICENAQNRNFEEILSDVANTCKDNEDNETLVKKIMTKPIISEEAPESFLYAVRKAKDYIAAGDIFQANLSRRWSFTVDTKLCSDAIYANLCKSNPAPFAGLAYWQDTAIVSSSPERLLSVRNRIISTRPIAGTRPRSMDPQKDTMLSAELISHPKERAEHVMLIDLERNDLGRVCKAGTVEVDEMMVVESYAHVHHIVSNVRGLLRKNVTPGQTIRAIFPGGTITGCPKVRCMEIIAELEQGPRGAYTGSFGYLNRDGNLDLNILIRTIVIHGNSIDLRAGSGIVADSDPQAELNETRVKAKGMTQALI